MSYVGFYKSQEFGIANESPGMYSLIVSGNPSKSRNIPCSVIDDPIARLKTSAAESAKCKNSVACLFAQLSHVIPSPKLSVIFLSVCFGPNHELNKENMKQTI